MSRCFPFPPPGYEKKARLEDTDLLTKKKYKKDKKDKEKKKERERSKEKHSGKKERKEKHKDKKDRDKEKDKNRSSDSKRTEGQPEFINGDKLQAKSLQNNEISDSKYVQDLARRIRNDDSTTGSQIGQKITFTDHRRDELPGRMVVCSDDNQLEEKERAKYKKEDDKKVNGQRNHIEVKSFGNANVSGFSSVDQKRFQGIAKPAEKNDIGRQMEEREKNKCKESHKKDSKPKESYNKDSKHKDRDPEKKSRSKDENRDKEKKKEEKAKEISEASKEQLKLKDSNPKLKDGGKRFPNSCNIKPPDVLKMSSNNLAEGSLGKRKEPETNGISHDNGIRPNKLLRPVSVSSFHQVMENGRKLESCQTDMHLASERQGAAPNLKVDVKEHKINGLMEVPKPIVPSSGRPTTIARVSENGEIAGKPPHPDSKYLNQILSVPKVEDLSDLDGQEWLFRYDSLHSKKPKVGSPEADGTEQAWAEALRIESADVTALPYVIPF